MKKPPIHRIRDLIREHGVLRPRDLAAHGIPREYLRRAIDRGIVVREARGLYVLPDSNATENHTLAQACKRVPSGVVCLLSALRFHDLTTQAPSAAWLAIGPKVRRPRVSNIRMRFFRFSGSALSEGVESHIVEGVSVNVYDPAKTVADCFKYRNKIGLDVALEALRETWRERRASMDDLWRFAKVCRVANVMRPYMESLV